MISRYSLLVLCLAVAPLRVRAAALDELTATVGAALPSVATPAAWPAATDETAPSLPGELTVHERIFSFLTDTFDLKAGGASFGTITEKFFSLTKAFTYNDAQGRCVAEARARLFSWGTHIDVADCSGRPIGAIKENVLKSFFKVWTTYSILDAQGREVANSEKIEWISTDLVVRRPDGGTVAELHRPWLNILSDNWTVKIRDQAAVDPRLIVLIAAYKTSVDNDRRAEEEKKHREEEDKRRSDDNDGN